ncbi:hypothetical protein IW150_007669, partial [Coemansia sp. RSA 2607]
CPASASKKHAGLDGSLCLSCSAIFCIWLTGELAPGTSRPRSTLRMTIGGDRKLRCDSTSTISAP